MVYKRIKSGNIYGSDPKEVYVCGNDVILPKPAENDCEKESAIAVFDLIVEDARDILRGERHSYSYDCLRFVNEGWLSHAVHQGLLAAVMTVNGRYLFNYEALVELRENLIRNGGLNPYAKEHFFAIQYKLSDSINSYKLYEKAGRFSSKEEAETFIQTYEPEIDSAIDFKSTQIEWRIVCCDE